MQNYSNNIKVALFADNVLEQLALRRTNSVVVQHYNYALQRVRNPHGVAYGNSPGGILTIDVRIGSRDNMRTYYERLSQNYSTSFSLVFNAQYDELGILEQMKLRFRVLINSLTCIGATHNLTQNFSK